MDKDTGSNKEGVNTTSLHNLMFFIIIVLLCAILYFTYKTYNNTIQPQNIGSLEHYDSLYSERKSHITLNQEGHIIGYNAPNGMQYTFESPIPADIFYSNID